MEIEVQKKRRNIMMAINAVAAVAAVSAIVVFFKFHLAWAMAVLIAALIVGFAAQVWFLLGLRPATSNTPSAPKAPAGKGA